MNITNRGSVNILVTGVGGQGVLLVSKVIAAAATENRFYACRTESRGLSQRGGSVCSEVRFGWNELTPVIGAGEDFIIGLDGLESVRMMAQLKPDGLMLANSSVIVPAHMYRQPDFNEVQKMAFENRVLHALNSNPNAVAIDFLELVSNAGCEACLNSAMIGAAAVSIPLPQPSLRKALSIYVKSSTVEDNLRAFDVGYCAMKRSIEVPHLLAISA